MLDPGTNYYEELNLHLTNAVEWCIREHGYVSTPGILDYLGADGKQERTSMAQRIRRFMGNIGYTPTIKAIHFGEKKAGTVWECD